jgi:hypothetical protein
MNIQQALKIKEALLTLSDALNISAQDIASRVCFFDEDKFEKLKKASDLWNEFDNADIVERGAMLGIKIYDMDNGSFETDDIILSMDV